MDAKKQVAALPGLHHVTAIAGDPQRNVDFYGGLLGLRLIKVTVNFDDPGTYHLYYGDGIGSPGSIMTFFPWPHAPRARTGSGAVAVTAFSIPREAMDYWMSRLREAKVNADEPFERDGEAVIALVDPDGLKVELVGAPDMREVWAEGPVPAELAVRGLHNVTLWEIDPAKTADLLTGTLGFRRHSETGDRVRFAADSGAPGQFVDVLATPGERRAGMGAGVVHHVAWRTPDDPSQLRFQQELMRLNYHVSPVMDRQYFHSIYFREPGGVLFEIATDAPGFAVDETAAQLGTMLSLPPWMESKRDQIRGSLPALKTPQGVNLP